MTERWGLLDGWKTLGEDINRVKPTRTDETKQGAIGDLLPEMSLDIEDTELISMKDTWINNWNSYNSRVSKRQERNEKYWKGQFDYSELEQNAADKPEADNLIFEALETFLPLVTRQNPEPMVKCDNEDQGSFIKNKLADLEDTLKMKLVLRDITRHWALYFVGVGKIGFDLKTNEITFKPVNPKKLILDPDANIEGGIYTGRYIGEYKTEKASEVISKFPTAKKVIGAKVEGKLATKITYIEWWCDDYLFWTMEQNVLDKAKNPHWNYEEEKTITDEFGNQTPQKIQGKNHFTFPHQPYAFLTVFNLGNHPMDDTSLVMQNLYLQDLIHKRLKQLNVNIDNINGGWVFSGRSGLTEEQAAQAIAALRRGGAVFVQGSAGEAIAKVNTDGLSPDVFNSLMDYRNELRNIFGVRGSSAAGVQQDNTVRGKILAKGSDDSRTALISEYLEQFADYVFNWFVQMMYVYYDDSFKAKLQMPMVVSVKEGSLIPKDSLTRRNEAMDLWSAGALSPSDLYKRLEDPNPQQTEQNLIEWKLWNMQPQPVMPEQIMPAIQQQAQQQAEMAAQAQAQIPTNTPEQMQSNQVLNALPT